MSGDATVQETSRAGRPFLAPVLAVLTFRGSRADLDSLDRRHLLLGLALTGAVGAGRNWADPAV